MIQLFDLYNSNFNTFNRILYQLLDTAKTTIGLLLPQLRWTKLSSIPIASFIMHEITKYLTTKGNSHEMPEPLCRAAIVVGPPKEGIQKKPSVNNPFE